MIRRAARAVASVLVVIGWVVSLLWLTLSVSQIAVGGVNGLPTCQAPLPDVTMASALELNRAIVQEVTRC